MDFVFYVFLLKVLLLIFDYFFGEDFGDGLGSNELELSEVQGKIMQKLARSGQRVFHNLVNKINLNNYQFVSYSLKIYFNCLQSTNYSFQKLKLL